VQDKSEKLSARAWIYMQPGGSVLESSTSFQRVENETKRLPRPSFCEVFLQRHFDSHAPLLVRFFFSVIPTATKHLPRLLGFFSIISMD